MDGLALELSCNEGIQHSTFTTGGQLASSLEITPDLFHTTGSQAGASGYSTAEVQQFQNK